MPRRRESPAGRGTGTTPPARLVPAWSAGSAALSIVVGISAVPCPGPGPDDPAAEGRRLLIVCGDLSEPSIPSPCAVIVHHWRWIPRSLAAGAALGVGRMTPGSTMLWQSLRPLKLTPPRSCG